MNINLLTHEKSLSLGTSKGFETVMHKFLFSLSLPLPGKGYIRYQNNSIYSFEKTPDFPSFPWCPILLSQKINFTFQSGRRVSNPQPPAWKAGALPIELLPLILFLSIHSHSPSGDRRIRTSEVVDNRFTVCPIWPLWYVPF